MTDNRYPPRKIVIRADENGHQGTTYRSVVASGKVNLAQQEDPNLCEAEHDQIRRLGQKVSEVPHRQEK